MTALPSFIKNCRLHLCLLFGLLTVACGPTATPVSPTLASTVLPSLRVTSTVTAVPPTATLYPNATIVPEAVVLPTQLRCPESNLELVPFAYPGLLVFGQFNAGIMAISRDDLFHVGLGSDQKQTLKTGLSPDGRWLAYRDFSVEPNQLWIVSVDGQTRRHVTDWATDDWPSLRWYSSEELLALDQYPEGTWRPRELVRIADGIKLLAPQAASDAAWDVDNLSPDGRYLAYSVLYTMDQAAILDFVTRERIMIPGGVAFSPPKFSPDGRHLAYRSPDINALVIMSFADGVLGPATHFMSPDPAISLDVGVESWSPDGRYVLIWAEAAPNDPGSSARKLVILDTQAKLWIDLCLVRKFVDDRRVYWSPDSRYLAVQERDPQTGYWSLVQIIEVETGERNIVAQGGVIGWAPTQ